MYIYALVIVIILLVIFTSPVLSYPSNPSGLFERIRINRSANALPGLPMSNQSSSAATYCPYRALIGRWRTNPPPSSNLAPVITKEYEFSTLPDGKTILLRVRHIMSSFGSFGIFGNSKTPETSTFTRGACILTNFKCQNGFTGDVTVEAQCVSTTPAYYQAPLNELPSKFNVIVNSKDTLLIDVRSQEEFHKV